MIPSLLVVVVIFACFLAVLGGIAFAAYRFAAKREGPALGVAGGCALTTVLLGVGFFALVGFAILVGVLVVNRMDESGTFDRLHERIFEEHRMRDGVNGFVYELGEELDAAPEPTEGEPQASEAIRVEVHVPKGETREY